MCIIHTVVRRDGRHMKSREVIRLLEQDGWYLVAIKGSHHHYKHPSKSGKITVVHPEQSIPKGTLNRILKDAGLK
ncbi:YcfA-like protein [compost metagenome]